MKDMRFFALCFVLGLVVLASNGCEQENWGLVDPPQGGDSILVRFVNFCGDGQARSMSLDGKVTTASTADSTAAPLVTAPSDSSYVNVTSSDGSVFSVSGRKHFSKNSTELFVAVPSLPSAAVKRSMDTVLHFSTSRLLSSLKGYASLRLIVPADDSSSSFQLAVGCPNGSYLGTAVSARQSSAYISVPYGSFVVSLLHGQQVVGIYKLTLKEFGYYSFFASQYKGKVMVRVLDELDPTSSALQGAQTVPVVERVSFVRSINISNTSIDSITATGGVLLESNLAGRAIGSYKQITACASDLKDEFQLYSAGTAHQKLQTSVGVLARYSIVSFDTVGGSNPASRMAVVEPPITPTGNDSVSFRVVNALTSGESIRVRFGARSDAAGIFRNGEVISQNVSYGSVSALKRLTPGYAPITILSNNPSQPESLLGSFTGSFQGGHDYILIVDRATDGSLQLNVVESTQENASVQALPHGVFTQMVNARADKATINISMGSMVGSTSVSFTNSIATVVPPGTYPINAGSLTRNVTAEAEKRLTIVLSGDASKPDLIEINRPSMGPTPDTSKSRYLNACLDVPSVCFAVDSLNPSDTVYKPNIYADNQAYGVVSGIRSEARAHRINFVIGLANSQTEIYRPEYPVTLIAAKAYTVIFCGQSKNYYLILQQEY